LGAHSGKKCVVDFSLCNFCSCAFFQKEHVLNRALISSYFRSNKVPGTSRCIFSLVGAPGAAPRPRPPFHPKSSAQSMPFAFGDGAPPSGWADGNIGWVWQQHVVQYLIPARTVDIQP